MTIDTRFVHAGDCGCGRAFASFDLIIAGRIYDQALRFHDEGDQVVIYIEPDTLRVSLESDPDQHRALHAAVHIAMQRLFEVAA